MNLLEFEAKQLLKRAGAPIPSSVVIKEGEALQVVLPIVLKSQVPTGGRGKAGGILVIDEETDVMPAIKRLFTLPIQSYIPTTLLVEEKLTIDKEYYLSFLINRELMAVQLVAHRNGGIEVEDNKDFQTWTIDNPSSMPAVSRELSEYYGLSHEDQIESLVTNLYQCFIDNDATLIEINPLILTSNGGLVAGDCKMTLDDAASFRHDWQFEDKPVEANFVTINKTGNVATIANGAGLAMATVDAVVEAGLTPANFLDIGGGANTETLLAAFHRLVDYPHIQAIVINIFAGITRSDEVARAIIAARSQIENLPPLFIRLAGTNYQEAAAILAREDIPLLPSLESCLRATREVING